MENSAKIGFLLLSAFAIGYAIWQLRILFFSLRTIETQEEEKGNLIFRKRQIRRRIQISILIGICGVCMFFGMHFSHLEHPSWFVLSWALAILTISWTIVLAIVDVISIQLHYKKWVNRNLAEEYKWKYKLEQELRKEQEKNKKP